MTYTIKKEADFHIISISGDIVSDNEARSLTFEISRLAKLEGANFCFNLEEATYLNSSGISVFIHALAEVENAKGSMYMAVNEPVVRNVTEMAGLDKLVKTYDTFADFKKEHLSEPS